MAAQLVFQLPSHTGCRDEFLADFRTDVTSPCSILSQSSFWGNRQHRAGCLECAGTAFGLPVTCQIPTHHVSACHCHVELEVTEAKLVCHLPLYIRAGQAHEAGHDIPAASMGSLHILLRPSSCTEVRNLQLRLSSRSAVEQILHGRKIPSTTDTGFKSITQTKQKPGSSLV